MKVKPQFELFKIPENRDLAQHNNLITGRYSMGVIESRIFISMLARLNKNDSCFDWIRIPINEVLSTLDGNSYKSLKEACDSLTGFKINARKQEKDTFDFVVIVARCMHKKGSGYIYAKFYDDAKPFLLQLAGNFTTAELYQLTQLKNPHAIRIYWLLKSLFNTNQYRISISELKAMLFGKEAQDKYELYADFKRRILLPVQEELQTSDRPFTFKEVKEGRAVKEIIFQINSSNVKNFENQFDEPIFNDLISLGISIKSIPKIADLLKEGVIDEGYINYVISVKKKEKAHGKIKSLNGAIYKAIIDLHLIEEYKTINKQIKPRKSIFNQPAEIKFEIISMNKAEEFYKEALEKGTTTYPFTGFIKALKVNKNTIVEGFTY